MNIVITILLVLAGIIALFLIIALFTKKEFRLEKHILINKPKQVVFNDARLLKNQENYSVWVMKDPNIKIVYGGMDGKIGATSAWESNDKNVGIGAQEIIELVDGISMKTEIRFKKPFVATNYALTTVTDAGNGQTKISTAFSGKPKFSMHVMNLMMEKMVGKDM
jgi:hypothetical protein